MAPWKLQMKMVVSRRGGSNNDRNGTKWGGVDVIYYANVEGDNDVHGNRAMWKVARVIEDVNGTERESDNEDAISAIN